MLRIIQSTLAAILLAALASQSTLAQAPNYLPHAGYGNQSAPNYHSYGVSTGPGYPKMDAPLYTSPVQYVPEQMGGAYYTNQAFAPHEMLYPHKYKAMYGPFYYKVKGHYVITRSGVKVQERWYLQGTEVEVDYKDHFSLFDNVNFRFFGN